MFNDDAWNRFICLLHNCWKYIYYFTSWRPVRIWQMTIDYSSHPQPQLHEVILKTHLRTVAFKD